MKYRNIMNISLQQIQIFLKCCQYQNYSRVAEEYNFTPSMVSKTIKNLENLLGIPLFIRKYHRLELTPAGRELEKGWKNLSQDLIKTITRAFDVQEQLSAHIRIGVLETTRFCADYVTMKLEDKLPEECIRNIEWERRDMHELPRSLEENLVDLIITWSGETPYLNSKISGWKKIFVSPDAVFIPRGHPLYNAPLTSFSECRAYPFISLSPATYPHYYRYLEALCHDYGFSPVLSTLCGSTDSARYNLSMGKGIYVAPSLLCADWESEDIEKWEIPGEARSGLIIAWEKEHLTPALKQIIDIIAS